MVGNDPDVTLPAGVTADDVAARRDLLVENVVIGSLSGQGKSNAAAYLVVGFAGFVAQDARELEIADAELRHVVNLLAASREENAALRAELAAADDAVLELLHDLEGGAAS